MILAQGERHDNFGALKAEGCVLFALMLRGVKSRLFGNGLGFLTISVGWPMVHMLALLIIYSVAGRLAPVGDSNVLFFATGVLPYITFNYITRGAMVGVLQDAALLKFPLVKPLDLLCARVALETLGSLLAAMCLILIIWFSGTDPMPQHVVVAACAYGASILLGIGMGFVNGMVCLVFPPWAIGFQLIRIPIWVSCGIVFVPDSLPEKARYYLSFNPVLHLVEWMRSAYYPGYGSEILNKAYPLWWALCCTFLALALERLLRGRVLGG